MDSKFYEGNRELTELVSAALDLGEQLLICGGEVSRVEDTIRRLCQAYGADRIDVFTITSSVIVTAHFPDRGSITQTRRISGLKFNLSALEALNGLSRRACTTKMEPAELRKELERIEVQPRYGFLQNCGIWALISGSFSVFFGGSYLDGMVSALIGILLCIVQAGFNRLQINSYFSTVLCSLLGGLLSNLFFSVSLPVNPAMINIGVIMLLIPGIALTNAIRDIFSGDTISGILRSSEALVLSVAIAWGFAVTASPDSEALPIMPLLQLLAAVAGSLGFSMLFNVRGRRLFWCAMGGAVGWGVVLLCEAAGLGEMTGYFIGSMVLTVYAEILARVRRCPATVFITTATIPLIPGGSLYNTMYMAMSEEWSDFAIQGLHTLVYAILISAGILVVNTGVRAFAALKKE